MMGKFTKRFFLKMVRYDFLVKVIYFRYSVVKLQIKQKNLLPKNKTRPGMLI